jgi:hypothetical protein
VATVSLMGYGELPPAGIPICTVFRNNPLAVQQSLAKSARWRHVASHVCFVAAAAIFVGIVVVSLSGTFALTVPIVLLVVAAAVIVPGFFLKADSDLRATRNNILSQKRIIDPIVAFQKDQPSEPGSADTPVGVINWAQIQYLFWRDQISND